MAGIATWNSLFSSNLWPSTNNFVNLSNTTDCPLGDQWIWNTFGQCVITSTHYVAFTFGFISLLLWMLPLIPQIVENYKRGNCEEALSIYFLLFWILGDTCNVIGAVLTKQLPSQIIIGGYYIVQDFILLAQFAYYSYKNKWRQLLHSDLGNVSALSNSSVLRVGLLLFSSSLLYHGGILAVRHKPSPYVIEGPVQTRKLTAFFVGAADETGYALGIASALSYFLGRLPQLYKNYHRKSTEGVSLAMFIIIIFANLTYGLSVILAGTGSDYILHHLPWLLGSWGCCLCDIVVVCQFCLYTPRRAIPDIQEQPIINNSD